MLLTLNIKVIRLTLRYIIIINVEEELDINDEENYNSDGEEANFTKENLLDYARKLNVSIRIEFLINYL